MAETTQTPVLHLDQVRKSYVSGEDELEVLHGIDLTLQRGEFSALIGPSGSGKSTLLNLIGLLDRPSTGKLFIENIGFEGLEQGGDRQYNQNIQAQNQSQIRPGNRQDVAK